MTGQGCKFWGFYHSMTEDFIPLGCDNVSMGNWLPRETVSHPRITESVKLFRSFLNLECQLFLNCWECDLSDWERSLEWDPDGVTWSDEADRQTNRQLAYWYMCCRHCCGGTRCAEQHGTDNTGRSGCSEEETIKVELRWWWWWWDYVRAACSSLHKLPCITTVVRYIFFLKP